MAFTKSLLIKAIGGVAGVGGTTVGVLAGTTDIFTKSETTKTAEVPSEDGAQGKDTTQKNPSDNDSIESDSVKGATKEQDSIQGGSSVGQESIQTGSSAPENQERSTTDGQQRDSGSGGGNLAPNPVQSPGGQESLQPESDTPREGAVDDQGRVSQEEQKGQVGKVTEEPGSPQPETGSHEGQTSDKPKQSDSGLQTGQGGGDEHRSDSASEISKPGTPGSQGEGTGGVDTNPQPSGEEQKTSEVNTGAPAGTVGGNSGGSTPPGIGGTPGSTGDNGAAGGRGSELPDLSSTDQATQTQEDKINTKLGTLNIPDGCKFVKGDTSKTCSINKEELNKMKFNDGNNSVSGSVENNVENLQLKIEILTGSKKTAYGINDDTDEEEESDVTKDLLFTFSGFNNEINLDDDGFILYPNTNPEFKIEDDELVKVWDQAVNLAEKVGIKNNKGTYSFEENTTTLKYSLDGTEAGIKTLNSPTTSGTIDVEGDKDNYNQGVKVTFREKVTGTESESLDANTSYEIKYDETQGWYLSKKNEGKAKGIQGAGGRGVNNPEQPQHAQQSDGSPSSGGLSSEQQLNNNQQEQVPTVDTNSISRTDVSDTVDNEEDTATDLKVKETNIKLKELKIPKKCRFTDSNKDEPLECSLSKDEFKEISFEDREVDESLLEENGEPFVMKLIIERLSESKKKDYENEGKQVDLLFTFKDFKAKIENGCKRKFKVNKDLALDENTNPEFEGNSENFKSLWDYPSDLAKKVGLFNTKCDAGGGSGSSCFKFDQKKSQSTKFSIDKGNNIKEVNIPEDSQQKAISFTAARGYSQGFRFLFKEAVTFDNDNTLPAGGYEIVYKNGNGWYLSRVSESTAENWNEQDSDGNLCVSEEE